MFDISTKQHYQDPQSSQPCGVTPEKLKKLVPRRTVLCLGQSDMIWLVLQENPKICFPSGHVSTPSCAGVSQQKQKLQKLHVVNTESTIWWAAGLDNTQLGTGFGIKNSQDEHQLGASRS